jgi:hypothetical protein
MSKQFYVYLLPEDVDSLVCTLKSQLDVSLIQRGRKVCMDGNSRARSDL